MSFIIVKSDIQIIQKSCTWYNIHLTANENWEHAIVKINNNNINTIYQNEHYNKIHIIEFNFIKNIPSLLVNNMIVYQNKQIFDFEVLIQLTNNVSIYSLDELTVRKEYNFHNIHYISQDSYKKN